MIIFKVSSAPPFLGLKDSLIPIVSANDPSRKKVLQVVKL